MKKAIFILIISVLAISNSYSQKVIEMEYSNGVYYVPCKINDIPMKFIFDTGASNVSISITEAMFLLKHGALKDKDLKESVKYKIANGEVQEGTKIIIREINIDGIILKNVEAGIVHQLNAPLLLGQSAISKLGKIKLDGNRLIINSDSSSFLNIDFNKNLYEYEYNFDKNVFPLKVPFEYLTKNTNHFLKGFGFEESAIFTEDGILTLITLDKKGSEEDLENIFVKVFKLLYNKYGLPSEKTSDNKKFDWELKQFSISFGYSKDFKSLNLFCLNPSKELYINMKLYLKDENTLSEEKTKTKEELGFISLNKLAEQGNANAQFNLARKYYEAKGELKDFKKSTILV